MNAVKMITNKLEACTYCKATQLLKTCAAAGATNKIAAGSTYFRKATFLAMKGLDGTLNVGNVKIGVSDQVAELPIIMAPGDERTFEAPVGAKWSLSDWYVLAATDIGDGVVVIYS